MLYFEVFDFPQNVPYYRVSNKLLVVKSVKIAIKVCNCLMQSRIVSNNAVKLKQQYVINYHHVLVPGMWKRLFFDRFRFRFRFYQQKTIKRPLTIFLNFCGSVACLLLHFIILRGQKPSFIAITLPTSLELIVPNYSVFLLFRY